MTRPLCALLATCLAATAHAQPAATGKTGSAIAEQLFREGQALTKAGRHPEACEKFAASQKADPALGTLLNLAVCHEKTGRTASAWAEFAEVASMAATAGGQKDRETLARARMRALEPKLMYGTIAVREPAPELEVRLDDSPLPPLTFGQSVPLDPGIHTLTARAPGRLEWSGTFEVRPAPAQNRVEVPPLEVDPQAALAAAAATPTSGKALLVSGSIGLGLGVGSVVACAALGLRAKSLAEERDTWCTPGRPCIEPAAYEADRNARIHEQASIITGIAGTAALGVGLALVLLGLPPRAPTEEAAGVQVAPLLGADGAGLVLSGRF